MDSKTYHQLFLTYYPSLCRYAESILEQPADAEDVVADVFVKLWHQQRTFHDGEHLKAYLYRAIKNACIDFLRTRVHQGERNSTFLERLDRIEQGHLHALVERELLRELYVALQALSPQDQLIIRLGFLEGYTNQQLADRLGLALQTVKNRKLKALVQLRKHLSEEHFFLLWKLVWIPLFSIAA